MNTIKRAVRHAHTLPNSDEVKTTHAYTHCQLSSMSLILCTEAQPALVLEEAHTRSHTALLFSFCFFYPSFFKLSLQFSSVQSGLKKKKNY